MSNCLKQYEANIPTVHFNLLLIVLQQLDITYYSNPVCFSTFIMIKVLGKGRACIPEGLIKA